MYVNHDKKFIYLENPKSGSTSILIALSQVLGVQILRNPAAENAHYTTNEAREIVGEDIWNSYYKVTTYREPLSRFISSANYPRHHRLRQINSFDEYEAHLHNVMNYNAKCQYCIHQDEFTKNVDFVIRLDHVQEDFNAVCKYLKVVPCMVRKINSNNASKSCFPKEKLKPLYDMYFAHK